MRPLVLLLIIFLLLAVQGGFLNPLHIAPVNLVLLLIVAAVLFSELPEIILVAMIGGIFSDLVSGTPDGLITLTLLSAALSMYFIFTQILSRSAQRAILVGSTAFGHALFLLWFLAFNAVYGIFGAGIGLNLAHYFLHEGLLGLLWNMALAYPVFQLFLWIDELIPQHHAQPIRD